MVLESQAGSRVSHETVVDDGERGSEGRVTPPSCGSLSDALPDEVVLVEADSTMWDEPLLPDEERIAPTGVRERRREFCAGRACARRALAQLGVTEWPLLRGVRQEPLWPMGMVGSITHCSGYCAAAVAQRGRMIGVGIDAEPDHPLSSAVLDIIGSPREQVEWRALGADMPWPVVLFSAKESVYKVWYPITGRWLGFDDVRLLPGPHTSFTATIVSPAASTAGLHEVIGRYAMVGGMIVTAAWCMTDREA